MKITVEGKIEEIEKFKDSADSICFNAYDCNYSYNNMSCEECTQKNVEFEFIVKE